MFTKVALIPIFTILAFGSFGTNVAVAHSKHEPASIYDFKMQNIDGHWVNLSKFKGKVLLIVNVASKCGHTPQYANLEAMYKKYKHEGLVVLGFPENDFMDQEPGTNAQIKAFCEETYHVNFPMFAKIDVIGPNENPLYKWLVSHSDRPQDPIEWNFAKFLVDRDGNIVMRIKPETEPDSSTVVAEVQKQLAIKPHGRNSA